MGADNSTPSSAHRILVVEDDKLNRMVVRQMLKRMGVRADEASSARQAIDLLSAEPFDLVLMDIQMPDMDGLEATRAIRAGEAGDRNREIPIIAMSAYATSEDEEAGYAAGMSEYLVKPLSVQKFMASVASALDD